VPIRGYGTNRIWLGKSDTGGFRYFGIGHQEERAAITTVGAITIAGNHIDFNVVSGGNVTGFGGIPIDATVRTDVTFFDLNGNVTLVHTANPAEAAGKFVNVSGANKTLTARVPVLYRSYKGNLYEVA